LRTRRRTFRSHAGTRTAGLAAAALALIPAAAFAAGSGGASAPGSTTPINHPSTTIPNPDSPASCSQDSGGLGVGSTCEATAHRYVNPFKRGDWTVSRIDMGVDYIPNGKAPVGAIGDAKILGSSMSSGWPGGAFIYYKLLNGDHKGDVIFVAEHLTKLAKAGSKVDAGERIATALPGDPWLEIGWATKDGQARAYSCYSEGMETNSGREMARFLDSLGAKAPKSSRGPDGPSGKAC
jgi:hypothetical protein